MPRHFAIIVLALSACACSPSIDDARGILEESLPITKDIEYRNLKTYPGDVVCGEYSAYPSHAESKADFAPFIVVRGKLFNPPKDLELAVFCSSTPASALLEKTGIGPYTAENTRLAKITADLTALDEALDAYYRDNYKFPTARQGLAALVSRPAGLRSPHRYREGGYLASVPEDPWGRPYHYEEEQWGGTKGVYSVASLGKDGVEGGAGENADIGTDLLPYLRHIAVVLGQ